MMSSFGTTGSTHPSCRGRNRSCTWRRRTPPWGHGAASCVVACLQRIIAGNRPYVQAIVVKAASAWWVHEVHGFLLGADTDTLHTVGHGRGETLVQYTFCRSLYSRALSDGGSTAYLLPILGCIHQQSRITARRISHISNYSEQKKFPNYRM